MNQKTILLTKWGLTGNYKYDKLFAIWVCLSFASHSHTQFNNSPLEAWNIILGFAFGLAFLFFLPIAWVAYSPKNKFAPKFQINDTEVFLRPVAFGKPSTFQWNEISEVEMNGSSLVFVLKDNSRKLFKLDTSEIAIYDIRESLREVAGQGMISFSSTVG